MANQKQFENFEELAQIWANEPGSFLRITKSPENGAIELEWRTGPQGPVSASTARASLELTSYRAKRLGELLAGKSDREKELEDVLTSANCIARRSGEGTDWATFSKRIEKLGIGSVTAKVFKVPRSA